MVERSGVHYDDGVSVCPPDAWLLFFWPVADLLLDRARWLEDTNIEGS